MTQAIKTWFKRGDYVWVLNRTFGGTFIVEGKAAVLKVLGEDRALVCFDNGDKVERFIDKAAQPNPEHYVWTLNGGHYFKIDTDKAFAACSSLVHAYNNGAANGGSIDWADVDLAHELAREALGLPKEESGHD